MRNQLANHTHMKKKKKHMIDDQESTESEIEYANSLRNETITNNKIYDKTQSSKVLNKKNMKSNRFFLK